MLDDDFVTSDLHFFHKAMIKYASRPFSCVEEMNEHLVSAWNKVVPKSAVTYLLGDVSFGKPAETIAILGRLNGRIRLVLGNHDKNNIKRQDVLKRFEWVKDIYESKCADGNRIVMCHYPLLTWNRAHYGSLHVHGHSHGNLPDTGTTRLDIGVDTHPDYAPYSFSELMQRFAGRTYLPVDHHAPK